MKGRRFVQKDTDIDSTNGFWQTTTRVLSLPSSDLDERISQSPLAENHDAWGTYSDNLRPNEREGRLGDDTPPSNKPTSGSRNLVVLHERAGVFPVTESDSEKHVRIFCILSRVVSPCLS